MSDEDPEDDDWLDLEQDKPKKFAASVSISEMKPGGRKPCWTAIVSLRDNHLAWAQEHGPRFRVQIGGKAAEKIRMTPDLLTGRFELSLRRGGTSGYFSLGNVLAWPNEQRIRTEAIVSYVSDSMILTLPITWALSTKPVEDFPKLREQKPVPSSTHSFSINTAARGLVEAAELLRKKK